MNTYCINLSYRPDRWEEAQQEFPLLDLDVTRFEAIHKGIGWQGCKASHMALLRKVKREGVFMIAEDDIEVVGKKKHLDAAMDQLPENWDMLYLGANLTRKIERYSKNLFRLQGGLTVSSIIYNNQNGVCDHILENIGGQRTDLFMIDHVQPVFNCFITYPMIMTQRAGFSDIINKYTSYRQIKRNYRKYTR